MDQMWVSSAQFYNVLLRLQGMCRDLIKVSYTHTYEVAVFNSDQANELSRTLTTLKGTVHEVYVHFKFYTVKIFWLDFSNASICMLM